MKLDEAA